VLGCEVKAETVAALAIDEKENIPLIKKTAENKTIATRLK
jgi:hypothetical protein